MNSLQWVNESNNELKSSYNASHLDLSFTIDPNSNGTRYTCIVSEIGFEEAETITIEVKGKLISKDADPLDIIIIDDCVLDVVNVMSNQITINISCSYSTILNTNEYFIIMYGTTSENLSMASYLVRSMPDIRQYSIQLVSLHPGTTYYYQINSTACSQLVSCYMEHNITTKDARKLLSHKLL